MSKNKAIFEWLKTCPVFSSRLSFASGETGDGCNVVLPFGSSSRRSLTEYIDAIDGYNGEFVPNPSVYEEYQVQCFRYIDAEQNEYNLMTLDEVQSVLDWIIEQDEKQNFPDIGETVLGVEPLPFVPQAAGRDVETGLWRWYFTLRVTYVNRAKRRCVDED